jgi:hypothetical protein
MLRLAPLALLILALLPASAMAARSAPPQIVATSALTTNVQDGTYSFGAVVRFDRALTRSEQRRFGLIATPWASRARLRTGARLPDALHGGTSLGHIGAKAKHCYLGEVATLRAVHKVRNGGAWRLALHDGHRVLRVAPRTVARTARPDDPAHSADALGCS